MVAWVGVNVVNVHYAHSTTTKCIQKLHLSIKAYLTLPIISFLTERILLKNRPTGNGLLKPMLE